MQISNGFTFVCFFEKLKIFTNNPKCSNGHIDNIHPSKIQILKTNQQLIKIPHFYLLWGPIDNCKYPNPPTAPRVVGRDGQGGKEGLAGGIPAGIHGALGNSFVGCNSSNTNKDARFRPRCAPTASHQRTSCYLEKARNASKNSPKLCPVSCQRPRSSGSPPTAA